MEFLFDSISILRIPFPLKQAELHVLAQSALDLLLSHESKCRLKPCTSMAGIVETRGQTCVLAGLAGVAMIATIETPRGSGEVRFLFSARFLGEVDEERPN